MTCAHAPQTLDDFLAVIDRCAQQAGGPHWAATAMWGLAALSLALLAVVLLAMLAERLR
jgi:hypothetical protein